MKLKIEIRMENAAFADENGIEVARILRKLADDVDNNTIEFGSFVYAYDSNGNKVGQLTTSKR